MKQKTLVVVLLLILCFSGYSTALSCSWCNLDYTCDADTCMWFKGWGQCYPNGWKYFFWCSSCPKKADAYCGDYDWKEVCEKDPCQIGTTKKCQWDDAGGYCHAGCGSRTTEEQCRLDSGTASGCLPDYYKNGNFRRCLECPKDMACNKYKKSEDCSVNTCKIQGGCMWWGDKCVADADADGCPDAEDNCPAVPNMDKTNRRMNNTFCDSNEDRNACDREGDACDDTDGDGLTDEYELNNLNQAAGIDPLNTDANANCIPDGVEFAFNPIINVLKKIAVAVATVMMAYLAVGWLTSDTPAQRDNAKRGVIYIIAGLIILAGGKELVIFLLQSECSRPPNVGQVCAITYKICPTAPAKGGSCPFIYSFNGTDYILEHEGYPFSALPPWEAWSYSVLSNLYEHGGVYRIRLSEELPEESFTDSVQLYIAGHREGVRVYPDLNGSLHTISDPIEPSSCFEEDGSDCLEYMKRDGVFWSSSVDDKHLYDSDGDDIVDDYRVEDLYDGIVVSFPNPEEKTRVKLLLRVKESGGVSLASEEFLRLLGKRNAEMLFRLSLSNHLFGRLSSLRDNETLFSVRVWDGEKWVLEESFGVGGVVASEMVLPLSVPVNDTVYIKLDSAVSAYEVDYVLVDYSKDDEVDVVELKPFKAESFSRYTSKEALDSVMEDDGKYLNLSTGEYVELYFKAPLNETPFKKTPVVSVKGFFLSNVSSYSANSLDDLWSAIKFVSDPTYGIRYTYLKYLRSRNNDA